MKRHKIIFFFICIILLFAFKATTVRNLPYGFVYATEIIPNLKLDLRYLTSNNFIGKPVNGYNAKKCILTVQTANALKKVEDELQEQGLCLIIYDAYRPQKAVNHFKKWAKNIKDTLMKQDYYPTVKKRDLFKLQYISTRSRHSSGSTVDLSIFSDKTNAVLDMGSNYDYFSEKSWVNYQKITKKQRENRQLLQTIMLNNGFRSYPKEWWHFTLRYEPYRNHYFDFNVE
ncbi:MAG: M15 family metallopeptidase [Flavobacteriaceae bacterium]|nr:M15 family metallopeptidase [Flavobacteriaceae bacterium]